MDNELHKYLALKITEDIRKGIFLSTSLIEEISRIKITDMIRNQLYENDIDILRKYLGSEEINLKLFAIDLLQRFIDNESVQKEMLSLWEQTQKYEIKAVVMFRLLDNPDLNDEMHNSFYDFIEQNWNRWINDRIKIFADGDTKNILYVMKSRLSDKRFPLSKAWIYLLISTASPDLEGCRQLIDEFKGKNIPCYSRILEKLNTKNEN